MDILIAETIEALQKCGTETKRIYCTSITK